MTTRYVDLDGTLAQYFRWEGAVVIGDPVPEMVRKVQIWLARGDTVKVFTARISPDIEFTKHDEVEAAKNAIRKWCVKNIGVELEITREKDHFEKVYDDRAEHIEKNTGKTREEILLDSILWMKYEDGTKDQDILNWVIDHLASKVAEQNA